MFDVTLLNSLRQHSPEAIVRVLEQLAEARAVPNDEPAFSEGSNRVSDPSVGPLSSEVVDAVPLESSEPQRHEHDSDVASKGEHRLDRGVGAEQSARAAETEVAGPSEATPPDPKPTVEHQLRTILAEYEGLLRRYNQDFDQLFASDASRGSEHAADTELGESELSEANLLARLSRARLLLLKYPLAAQAAFGALVEDGRRYSKTVSGQRWKNALQDSPILSQLGPLLESLSAGALRPNPEATLPSALVDSLLQLAGDPRLESLLSPRRASPPQHVSNGGQR